MKPVFAWFRRQFSFSNSRSAWLERLAGLGLFVAGVGGWWVSRGMPLEGRLVLAGLWLVVTCQLMRAEIIHLLGPVFFFEILCGSRRWVHLTRSIYACLLLSAIIYIYLIEFHTYDPENLREQAEMAGSFFLVFFGIQMLLVGLLTPVLVAGSIAEEKERRTLEFVLATDLRGREIVLGKLGARLAAMLLLVLAGLPVLSFLQFFGGIDPDELLAAMLVTVVTLVSVAVLSIASSVFWRRGRDAIVATVALMIGYAISSGIARALRVTSFGRASVTIGTLTVGVSDFIDAFQAGNPFVQAVELVRLQEFGNSYGSILRDMVREYVIFHTICIVSLLSWAVVRLRPIALRDASGNSLRGRQSRLPKIGSAPMRWKELFAERGPRLHIAVRAAIVGIVLASFIPAVIVVYNYFVDAKPSWAEIAGIPFTDAASRYEYPIPPMAELQEEMNAWVRFMAAALGVLLLLAVAVRAAISVTGERARQTLDELLTSRLTNGEIVISKWQGSLMSVRRGWIWMTSIFAVGLASGGVNLLGATAAVLAWFCYAIYFASLGMWFTVNARNSFRAIVYTFVACFVALGGHWIFTAICCCLPMASGHSGGGDWIAAPAGFLTGLTPPAVLAVVSMRAMSELHEVRNEGAVAVFFGAWGPIIFLIAGMILRGAAVTRFAENFNRTDRRKPERHGPVMQTAGRPPTGAERSRESENQSPATETPSDNSPS